MRPRLFACLGLALVVVSVTVMVSQRVLAQAGQPPQGQRSQDDQNQNRQRGQFSEDIDKALQSYDERMDRNLEKCRKELDQMKKELHDLIDMRINMAMSLYELRAKMHVHGQGAMAGVPGSASIARGYAGVGGGRGQGSQGNDSRHGHSWEMAGELQQLHNQLRAEVDQQQNQIAQLAAQLRTLKDQEPKPGSAGESPKPKSTSRRSEPIPARGPRESTRLATATGASIRFRTALRQPKIGRWAGWRLCPAGPGMR